MAIGPVLYSRNESWWGYDTRVAMMYTLQMRKSFFNEYLHNPKEVGSITPSSRYLTRAMLFPIPWDATCAVAELGPGTGVMTREILARMPVRADARLVAFETNTEYVHALRRIHDARFHLYPLSAWDIEAHVPQGSMDAVVSGIPLSNFSSAETRALLDAINRILRPGGIYVQFQYLPLRLRDVRAVFPHVHTTWELRNLPPACVYVASKS